MNTSIGPAAPFNDFIDSASGEAAHENLGEWLFEIKENGRDEFYKLGWPSPKLESWRYTNLNKLAKTQFRLPQTTELDTLPCQNIISIDAPRIVLVNGKLKRELSDLSEIGEGIFINSFQDMRDEQRALFLPCKPSYCSKRGLAY